MSIFGPADETTYYTLLIMPPNGNAVTGFGYTTTEIFAFWEANHETSAVLLAHSPIPLTQQLVDAAIALGSARALYRLVLSDELNSKYVINPITKQLPVPSKKFLVRIGIFDREIALALATCRVIDSTFSQAPALASGVQPPKQPRDDVTLSIQVPENASLGCAAALAANGVALLGVSTASCITST